MVRALNKIATDCPRRQSALKKRCRETLGECERKGSRWDSSTSSAKKKNVCLVVFFFPHCVQDLSIFVVAEASVVRIGRMLAEVARSLRCPPPIGRGSVFGFDG